MMVSRPGATVLAALHVLRERFPARIVVAVPVASRLACKELPAEVYELVCASMPEHFLAVGFCFDDLPETTDAEVSDLLARG
jgi:putative phosphoribosyl transferase